MDAFRYSGPWRQTRGCGGFWPGSLPGETQCSIMEYGPAGGPAYGLQLQILGM